MAEKRSNMMHDDDGRACEQPHKYPMSSFTHPPASQEQLLDHLSLGIAITFQRHSRQCARTMRHKKKPYIATLSLLKSGRGQRLASLAALLPS